MSALFGNLTSNGLEESQDRLGGNFGPVESDIYKAVIKAAYAGQAASGARSVSFIFDLNGREFRPTIYITNKKGENFFINKQDATKKVPLPGFTTVDDICLVATGKPLAEQDAEDKVIKLYDAEAGKELPKSVPMLVELLEKEVSLAILKLLVNKNVKNDATGDYEPTAETREENNIEKVFDTESQMTVNEARQGAEKAAFWDGWLERNKGKTKDKRTLKDGETGAVGAPPKARAAANGAPAPTAGAAPKKSLFGKKAA
jgi:hypothetical protein